MKDRLRKESQGVMCLLRLPGVCSFDPDTSVLCHLRKAGDGMARKPSDLNGVIGCDACHSVLDGRVEHLVTEHPDFHKWVHEGHMRTLDHWIETGSVAIRA